MFSNLSYKILYIKTITGCCKCSSWPYWTWRDPLLMRFYTHDQFNKYFTIRVMLKGRKYINWFVISNNWLFPGTKHHNSIRRKGDEWRWILKTKTQASISVIPVSFIPSACVLMWCVCVNPYLLLHYNLPWIAKTCLTLWLKWLSASLQLQAGVPDWAI